MPFAHNGRARIHWSETGTGEPLLLVMGARLSGEMWSPVIPAFAEHYRVIWFDNRGTGATRAPRGTSTIEAMTEDALAVLDAADVTTSHVYGVSMGGFIAQHMAMAAPDRVRSLLLGCTGAVTPEKPRLPKITYPLYWLPQKLYAPLTRKHVYGSSALPQDVAADLERLTRDRRDPRGLLAQARGIAAYNTTLSDLGRIEHPALVLHGEEDRVIPVAWGEELARTLPHARLLTYAGAGHNYFIGAGDQANADALAFLRGVSTPGAAD
jgi:3-oxoadipate enol-lactonase